MQFLSGGQLCSLNVQDITKWLQKNRQLVCGPLKNMESNMFFLLFFTSQLACSLKLGVPVVFLFNTENGKGHLKKIPCIKNLVSYCQLYWKKTAGILASWNLVLYFYFMPVSVRLCVVNESCDLKVFWWLNKELGSIHISEALLKIVKLTLRL